jgi:phosphoglycerate dehydrogenase-like enzyme
MATLGIAGLGTISRLMLNTLRKADCNVVAYTRIVKILDIS